MAMMITEALANSSHLTFSIHGVFSRVKKPDQAADEYHCSGPGPRGSAAVTLRAVFQTVGDAITWPVLRDGLLTVPDMDYHPQRVITYP